MFLQRPFALWWIPLPLPSVHCSPCPLLTCYIGTSEFHIEQHFSSYERFQCQLRIGSMFFANTVGNCVLDLLWKFLRSVFSNFFTVNVNFLLVFLYLEHYHNFSAIRFLWINCVPPLLWCMFYCLMIHNQSKTTYETLPILSVIYVFHCVSSVILEHVIILIQSKITCLAVDIHLQTLCAWI